MMVEIISVETAAGGEAAVEVASDLGQFAARWHGAAPAVGAHHGVELSFDHSFTWGVDAVPVEEQPHAIARGARGGVVLVARLEQLDDGGFVGLQLGPSAVMTDVAGEPPPIGSTVRFEAAAVTLFDVRL